MRNKRGISAIVATLMLILLAIVAFAIIATVIRQSVSKSSENIALSAKCLEIDMKVTKVINTTVRSGTDWTYNVTISRETGGDFPVTDFKIVFDEATGQKNFIKSYANKNMNALDKITYGFTIPFAPVKATVVPSLQRQAGGKYECSGGLSFDVPQPIPKS